MGINVGEVEVVLAARDTMSPALVKAAEAVQRLRGELETLGPPTRENYENFNKLVQQLALAENAFKAAGEAQQRQAEAARVAAEKSEQLAAIQARVSQVNEQVAGTTAQVTQAATQATAAVGRLTAANEASLASMITRYTEMVALLGVYGMEGKGFAADAKIKEMNDLGVAIRAMTSESRVAMIEQQALGNAAAEVAAKQKTLGTSVKATADATKEQGDAAKVAAGGIEQMDRMATRLLERLIILAALRGAFEFLKDMFVDAEKLVNMSGQTDMSLGKLQELQFGANATGVGFDKVGTAVDTLDKKLAAMHMTTSTVLRELGLSFEQLFALSPDMRFDVIARAIAALPTQLQRTRAETELFGTDAIDPLIKKYNELMQAARDSNAVMSDESVRALANTATMYRQLWAEIKPILSDFVVKWQEIIGMLAAPAFGGDSQGAWYQIMSFMGIGLGNFKKGRPATQEELDYFQAHGMSRRSPFSGYTVTNLDDQIDTNLASTGPIQGGRGGPLMNQAYIDSLKVNAAPLTEAQRGYLDQLREMNLLEEDRATHFNVTHEQFKAYVKSVQDGKHANSEYNQELKAMEGEWEKVNALWAKAIELSQQEGELGIGAKLQQNEAARVDALSKALNEYSRLAEAHPKLIPELEETYAQKVYAINQIYDEKNRVDKEANFKKESIQYAKNAEDIQKIRDQSFAASAELNLRGLELQMAQLDKQEQVEKDGWSKRLAAGTVGAIQYEEAISAIDEKYNNERARRAAAWEFDKWQQIGQIDEQAIAVEIGMAGDSMQTRLALNQKEYDARVSTLARLGRLDQDYLDHLGRLYEDKAQAIILSFDPLWKAYQSLNQDMRQEWANTWESAMNGTGKFADAIEAPFLSIERQFQKMIAAMIADWEYMLLQPLLSSIQNWMAGAFGVSPTTTPFTSGGGGGMGRFGFGGPGFGTSFPFGSQYAYFPPGGSTTTTIFPFAGDPFGSASTFGYMPMPGSGPYVQARDPMPSFGSMAGAGILSGIGSAIGSDNKHIGQQFEANMMMSAGFGAAAYMASGLTAGIVAGAVTFGIGAAVIGGIALIRSMMHGVEDDIARDSGEKFGQHWSDSLQETIVKRAKDIFHDEQAAEIASLPDIMKEHPVTAANLDMYEQKVHDIFNMIGAGHFTVEQAALELDQVFPQLAAAATDAYGRIDDKLRDIIRLNGEWGTQSKAIADFIKQQADSLGQNIPKLVDAFSKGSGRISTPEDARALAEQVKMAFAAMVASGMDPLTVMEQLGPSIENIRKAYSRLGIEADDAATRQLFMLSKIAQKNPELLAGLDALIRTMINFDNMNVETADLFAAQEKTGVDFWDKISKAVARAGGTTKDALGLIQDMLHEMLLESERLGVPLSDNIQKLIDQSKAAGVWQDAWTPKRTLLDGLNELIKRVGDLIDVLLGVDRASGALNTAAARARAISQQRGGQSNVGAGNSGGGDQEPIREAAGDIGFVDRPTLFMAGEAGPEWYQFSGANRPLVNPNTSTMGMGGGVNLYVTLHQDNRGAWMPNDYYMTQLGRELGPYIWQAVGFNKRSGQTLASGAIPELKS